MDTCLFPCLGDPVDVSGFEYSVALLPGNQESRAILAVVTIFFHWNDPFTPEFLSLTFRDRDVAPVDCVFNVHPESFLSWPALRIYSFL